jgi:hypothetical protein
MSAMALSLEYPALSNIQSRSGARAARDAQTD